MLNALIEQLGGALKKKTKTKFPADFKLEPAQLVVDQNHPVREAADAMDVGFSILNFDWIIK